MTTTLENIAESQNYADLPETWALLDDGKFSAHKTLYDYQQDALKNAARALYLYYDGAHAWTPGEANDESRRRKQRFFERYVNLDVRAVQKYETRANRNNGAENPVFRILSKFIAPTRDEIAYANLINRMCFWMATGSGKTLVMVKLIQYLHHLIQHGKIPPHNILMLAPSEHLLGQIEKTVDEFNQTGENGLSIELTPLREIHRERQAQLGNVARVFYHRSDNIADVQKEALTDYHEFENDGKWYVLLDEAHKGGKENSKRQAYYAVMARAGFLFNFSATFTDDADIATTVKKYNLREFTEKRHGKNIYLNEGEFNAFAKRDEEINSNERQKIVLKSLITLAFVSKRVTELRAQTQLDALYHPPLMLTLVNSVNTDVRRNDLWAFFTTLRDLAGGEIDGEMFNQTRDELIVEWRTAKLLFGGDGGAIVGMDDASVGQMTMADVRAAVFLSSDRGALQYIRSGDNKELAFQLRNAESPFALIRIGDTTNWRNELLADYEQTNALRDRAFFDELEQSPITILMGSRTFFESWDSNRPNVINFINIGGDDAKKFVVQSVGRGVRIEVLPHQRGRLKRVLPSLDKQQADALRDFHREVQPVETLFLFATNRKAVNTVLDGLKPERASEFELLEGFKTAPVETVGGAPMPLLVPEYREAKGAQSAIERSDQAKFVMSDATHKRLASWLAHTSDSVLTVRDGLATAEIGALRAMADDAEGIRTHADKDYAKISFLFHRLLGHLRRAAKDVRGVRSIDCEDIVHFRQISAEVVHAASIQAEIDKVRREQLSDQQIAQLGEQLVQQQITRQEHNARVSGVDESKLENLNLFIKKLAKHYYLPVILGDETSKYIQHIIKVPSEVNFINDVVEHLGAREVNDWDAWMFSKIDETVDKVHIPYYDPDQNEYRRFVPDFIFWMCRGNHYRVVFVDPKSTKYTGALHKIDGYERLFVNSKTNQVNCFTHARKWRVSVALWMYNPHAQLPRKYENYLAHSPLDIFRIK